MITFNKNIDSFYKSGFNSWILLEPLVHRPFIMASPPLSDDSECAVQDNSSW